CFPTAPARPSAPAPSARSGPPSRSSCRRTPPATRSEPSPSLQSASNSFSPFSLLLLRRPIPVHRNVVLPCTGRPTEAFGVFLKYSGKRRLGNAKWLELNDLCHSGGVWIRGG